MVTALIIYYMYTWFIIRNISSRKFTATY